MCTRNQPNKKKIEKSCGKTSLRGYDRTRGGETIERSRDQKKVRTSEQGNCNEEKARGKGERIFACGQLKNSLIGRGYASFLVATQTEPVENKPGGRKRTRGQWSASQISRAKRLIYSAQRQSGVWGVKGRYFFFLRGGGMGTRD